ncbi:hypothetical protein ISS42_00255 [Candidatus Shapirobacteria bacterium]|nr:hypothetical protein [Candidatus Shapirobacteria bacterium]
MISEPSFHEGEKRLITGPGGMIFDIERTRSGLNVLSRPQLEGARGEQLSYNESSESFSLFFTYSKQGEGYVLNEGQVTNGVFFRGQEQSAVIFAEVTQGAFEEDVSLGAFLYLPPNSVPDQAVKDLFGETRLYDPIELEGVPFNPVAIEFTDLEEIFSQIIDEKLVEKIKPIAERFLTQREAFIASQVSFPLGVEKLLTVSGGSELFASFPAFLLTKLVEQFRTSGAVHLFQVESVLKTVLAGVKDQKEKWALASFFYNLFGKGHCLVSNYDQYQGGVSGLIIDLLVETGTLSSGGSIEAIWREGFSGMTQAAFTYWLERQWLKREEERLFTKQAFFHTPLRETHEPLDGELYERWLDLANKVGKKARNNEINWPHFANKLAELALMGKFYPDGNVHFFHWGFGVENKRYAGDRGFFSREIYLLTNPNGVRLVLPLPPSAFLPATIEIDWSKSGKGWLNPELCFYCWVKPDAPFDYSQATAVSFNQWVGIGDFKNFRRIRLPLGQKRGGNVEAWISQGWQIVEQFRDNASGAIMLLLPFKEREGKVAVNQFLDLTSKKYPAEQYFEVPVNIY